MDIVQGEKRRYSQIQFTVKGWAITVFSGICTLSIKDGKPDLLLLAALSVLLFWILDAIFKGLQTINSEM
jgi:hypothetical protein